MHPNTPSTGTNTQKDGKTRAAVRYAAVMQVDEHKGAAMTNLSDIEKRCEAEICPFCGESPEVLTDGSWIEVFCCVSLSRQKSDYLTKDERQTWNNALFLYGPEAEAKVLREVISEWNDRPQVQDLQSKLATAEGLVALQQEQIGGMQRKVGEFRGALHRICRESTDESSRMEARAALNTETTG